MQAALRAVYGPRFPARARLATLWATVGGGSAASDAAVPAALAVRPLSVAGDLKWSAKIWRGGRKRGA